MKRIFKYTKINWTIFISMILLLPFVIQNDYWIQMVTLMGIYAILAYAMDFIGGYSGQVSMGHGGFYAIGAYTAGILATKLHFSFLPSFILSILVGLIFGAIVALPAIHVSGFYLAMETVAFALIVVTGLERLETLTGGVQGLIDIPSPTLGTLKLLGLSVSKVGFYYITWIIVLLIVIFVYKLIHSYYGRALSAIGGSEIAAESMGINTGYYKYITFTLSAGITAGAGALYAFLIGFLSPEIFGFSMSVFILAMALVGGMKSTVGPLIGAAIFAFLPQTLQAFRGANNLVYGLILMFSYIIIPKGLAAFFSDRKLLLKVKLNESITANIPFNSRRYSTEDKKVILKLEGITKSFGGNIAVKQLDMEVKQGEIHALIGPNGSGKTTTINIISGIHEPTEGKVIFNGTDITKLKIHQRAQFGISRTFQNLRIFPEMTVLENVLVGAHVNYKSGLKVIFDTKNVKDEEIRNIKKAYEVLEFLGLQDYANSIATELPYGIQKIVEVARAIVSDPYVVLLDEPAAGLTSEEIERLGNTILKLKEKGITVIIVEHHIDFVLNLADRVTVLDFGEKIFEGLPQDARHDQKVKEVYIGGDVAIA